MNQLMNQYDLVSKALNSEQTCGIQWVKEGSGEDAVWFGSRPNHPSDSADTPKIMKDFDQYFVGGSNYDRLKPAINAATNLIKLGALSFAKALNSRQHIAIQTPSLHFDLAHQSAVEGVCSYIADTLVEGFEVSELNFFFRGPDEMVLFNGSTAIVIGASVCGITSANGTTTVRPECEFVFKARSYEISYNDDGDLLASDTACTITSDLRVPTLHDNDLVRIAEQITSSLRQ